jgi:hypothetical protein
MENSSYFTPLSVALSKTKQNFAPKKPVVDLIQTKKLPKTPSRFEQSFKEWYTSKMNYEKRSRDEAISMAQLVALFRKGNQLLVRRPFGAPGYYVRPIQNDDTYRQTAMNIMTFYSQISESKLEAVNPYVNMRPGDETPEAIAAAQACRPVVDFYETQWYTSKFTRREAIRLLTDGIFIHQVRWNPFLGPSISSRQIGQIEQQIDGGEGSCADCQFQGEAEHFEKTDYGFQCPQCQSEATDVRPPQTQMLSQISMGPAQPSGEPEIISSSFASWHWDMSKDLECSSYAIKRQKITQGAINLMLGDITIPDSPSSDDYGLDVLHALTYAGQAFQGSSNAAMYPGGTQSAWDKRPTMFEAWLSPEDQAEIECDEGETICGVNMPKGRLSNFFQGRDICVAGLNDGALIIGTYADESHCNEVITCQWYMDAESGGGRGMEDTAAVQRRFNAVDGQIYQGLATTATPPVFVDLRMLREDQGKYLFKPGVNHDVNLSMLPVGMKLPDAIHIPQPGQVSPQFVQYGGPFLKQMGDLSALAVEFSDLLSIDNRTATGAQISAALANSLYGPMLMSKGESRVEIAKKIVYLYAKYGTADRYFPGKDNARGRNVGSECLKGKVIFELVENTHLPITPYSQQSDVTSLLQAFGGNPVLMVQLKAQDPELFRAITRPFSSLKLESEDSDDVSTLCLSRLEQMKEAMEMGIDDPNMLVQSIQPPVSIREPKQKEKQTWFSQWLDLDSAQKAPLVLRQAAEAMWTLHEQLMNQAALPMAASQGLIAGVGQAAAAAPSALGAQMLGAGQEGGGPDQQMEHDHEAQLAEQEDAAEAAHKTADQEHELRLKEMEGQTQMAITAQQGKNAIESAKIAGENQLKVQKAKPKPKAPKKAA